VNLGAALSAGFLSRVQLGLNDAWVKRTRGATTREPHGEEALLQRRLEPWAARPSFETRAMQAWRAPQDEGFLWSYVCNSEEHQPYAFFRNSCDDAIASLALAMTLISMALVDRNEAIRTSGKIDSQGSPADFLNGIVGFGKRSSNAQQSDGFRKGSTHPTGCWLISMCLAT
jgi:hypothetical protein